MLGQPSKRPHGWSAAVSLLPQRPDHRDQIVPCGALEHRDEIRHRVLRGHGQHAARHLAHYPVGMREKLQDCLHDPLLAPGRDEVQRRRQPLGRIVRPEPRYRFVSQFRVTGQARRVRLQGGGRC